MATEKYGVYAQLVKSIASTPVATDTTVIFIGASPSGDLNQPVLVTSLSDYQSKLGGAPGDGYNLTEAAIAAFSVAGIAQVYMIPVSNSLSFNAADYLGNADLFTGVYAIENLLRENPTTVNLLCAPSVTDSSVIAALNTIAKKADGHWVSFMVYDLPLDESHTNARNVIQPSAIVADKQFNEEHADAVWGKVRTAGGYDISGAAVRACLMAASDANYGVPARCGGNLAVSGIQGIIGFEDVAEQEGEWAAHTATIAIGETSVVDTHVFSELDYSSKLDYSVSKTSLSDEDWTATVEVVESSGHPAIKVTVTRKDPGDTSAAIGASIVALTLTGERNYTSRFAVMPESAGTQLSADGVCSWINYGGGNWHTWGDHTSAFSAGSVSDERARYDSNIRMLNMLTNRYQIKYRFDIDNPMTLSMRNSVIQEENDYLAYLKSIGAIIGEASCQFRADDNPSDNIALGQFVWSIEATITPPMKYAQLNVAFSQAGYSVYYAA